MISRRILLVLILILGIPTVVALAAGQNGITTEADPLATISLTVTHNTDHPSQGPFTYSLGAVFSASWNGSAGEPFGRPQDLAVDQSGHIFVTDSFNNRVYKFDLAGSRSSPCPIRASREPQTRLEEKLNDRGVANIVLGFI